MPSRLLTAAFDFIFRVSDADGVQVEYLWPAFSYIEPSGPSYTVEGGGGLLTMVPVHINANGKALTVEELHTQKKDMHINSFRYLLSETARELDHIADDEHALDRLARDEFRVVDLQRWLNTGGRLEWLLPGMSDGTTVTFTVAGLLAHIGRQCETVLEQHAGIAPERYNDDEAFRHIVAEMLETSAAATSTLRCYIEDPGMFIETVMRDTITTRHRAYLAFLERTLSAEGEARESSAGRLCRAMGAMQSSVDEVDAEGLTPLMRAAADGAGGRVLRCLVAARSDVNGRRKADGKTALRFAAEFGHPEAVEVLVRLGGDMNTTAYPGVFDSTPTYIAAEEGHVAVIEALGRLGADVNQARTDGITPVYAAGQQGHTSAIETLGKFGADVNRADNNGWTPVFAAVYYGHTAAIEALGCLGADMNKGNNNGWTPVHVAAEKGHTVAVEVLGKLGADVNRPDNFGCTPMYAAAQLGHTAVMEELGRLGADVNLADNDGRTPVSMAAERGHTAAIEALGKLGADVNRAEESGWTPLDIAKNEGHIAAADALLRLGGLGGWVGGEEDNIEEKELEREDAVQESGINSGQCCESNQGY